MNDKLQRYIINKLQILLKCINNRMLEANNKVHKSVNNTLHYHLTNVADKTTYGIIFLQYAI